MDPKIFKHNVIFFPVNYWYYFCCVILYSDNRGNQFREAHAFIGYQKDTPAAVIFQATNILKKLQENQGHGNCNMDAERLMRAGIISEDFVDMSQESDLWTEAVRCCAVLCIYCL